MSKGEHRNSAARGSLSQSVERRWSQIGPRRASGFISQSQAQPSFLPQASTLEVAIRLTGVIAAPQRPNGRFVPIPPATPRIIQIRLGSVGELHVGADENFASARENTRVSGFFLLCQGHGHHFLKPWLPGFG